MKSRIPALVAALSLALGAQACGPTDLPTSSSSALSNASGSPAASETRLTVALRPPTTNPAFPNASGKASFKSRPGRRELEMEVEHLPPGRRIDFFLGGVQVGARQTVNALGQARISLSTQLGQPVPVSVVGQRVVARTAGGVLVVAGSF